MPTDNGEPDPQDDPVPDDPEVGDPSPADTDPSGNDEPRFTQKDIDALVGKARKTGQSALRKELADQFGMPLSEVEKVLKAKVEADQAAMSEAERLQAEASAKIAEADARTAAANRAATEANVRSALLSGEEPCRSDRLEVALALALPKALESSEDEDDPIGAAVAHVRDLLPEVFGPGSNTDPATGTPKPPARPNGQRSTPPSDTHRRAKEMVEKYKTGRRSPMSPT